MRYDCIIIGGGASGLMLAASKQINQGLILEGTGKLGTKLMMSGGGHCNITHAGSIKDFVECYGEAGRVLRKALYRYSNVDLLKWLNENGVPTVLEGDRYFPESKSAGSIRDMLVSKAKSNGWQFSLNAKASTLVRDGDGWIVNDIHSDKVVIASGGITYPETGSDGSVFELLKGLGISVTELKPALAPIHVKNYPYSELSGISIPDVTVTAFNSNAANTCQGKAARLTGDILFTHDGFSGPVVLNISRSAYAGEMIRICYNKSPDELPRRFRKILEDRSRGDSGDIKTNKFAGLLESDEFVVDSIDKRGMVTKGGIDLSEIDAGTMEIRKCPGLFAIGEALDADGLTGGYNLQMCYSTARAAANSI